MGNSTVSLFTDPNNPKSNGTGGGVSLDTEIIRGDTKPPAVSLPENISSDNSNHCLSQDDPVDPSVWQRSNVQWSSGNRSLTVSYASLTLEGTQPYLLCSLTLHGGAELLFNSSSRIQIFFDSPENCPNNPSN